VNYVDFFVSEADAVMEADLAAMAVEDEKRCQAMFRARWKQGFKTGIRLERERVLKVLENYFDLTRFSVEVEGAEKNEDWDNGFQAAIALIKGESE